MAVAVNRVAETVTSAGVTVPSARAVAASRLGGVLTQPLASHIANANAIPARAR
jgi:hypothetical protein